ncbi:hypothetical protein FLAG1_06712 [Fusarium langsethiae]|uniref:Uncharacterized protein n=2 Tax=Fusarium sambucinum species complex TaxID=569360 RepID=A0A0M9EV58_FUSLA|nr:hypothetical protein FLAG1_06712 [Fusarium langsethiae]RGP74032.1 hypothetical protein FSPOR_1727 [Fusarium sporotrichioides]GKU05777.1 unnamed protein product [Fusarium langsethiae]GKU20847.1 unnamed protein product [Fusarium langsethiae]
MKFNQALKMASMALILPMVSAWDVQCYSDTDCGGEAGTLTYAPDDDISMQRFCLNVEGRKSCRFNQGASQSTWTIIGNSVQGECGGYDVRGSCATGNDCVNIQHPYGEYPERALVGHASTSLCWAGRAKRGELPWEA